MANCWWGVQTLFLFLMVQLMTITNKTFGVCGEHSNFMSTDLTKRQQQSTRLEGIQSLLRREVIRQRALAHNLLKQRALTRIDNIGRRAFWETKTEHVSFQMPMHSGADYGIGEYLVEFKAGTPSKKFWLVLDTGSDLTWMNCKYKCDGDPRKCSRSKHHRRVFQADKSSSFSTVSCSSDTCKLQLANLFSLAICPTPPSPCAYDYRYVDGSSTAGIFANETVSLRLTNGRKAKLHNTLIGCSQSTRLQSFQRHLAADGVLGLGYSNHSFAIKATKFFGGKFSYCLVDHLSPRNASSYLTFGTSTSIISTQYTTLGAINSFYAVNVKGISVGGVMLKIPSEIWDVNGVGGTIIDSGSSLSYLAIPAYKAVVAAFEVLLVKFQRLDLESGPLEYCFNSAGYKESVDVPPLAFHFVDGARFEPPVKSYVIDVDKGVKCLGFVPNPWPGVSVIGNIMQQNYFWEFDLIKGMLGFSPSSCS